MKMSDVFHSELLPTHIRVKATPVRKSMDDGVAPHEAICKAVNYHDTLTETNRLLNLECEELKGDVDRLKLVLSLMLADYQCTASICGQEGYAHDYDKISIMAKELLDK